MSLFTTRKVLLAVAVTLLLGACSSRDNNPVAAPKSALSAALTEIDSNSNETATPADTETISANDSDAETALPAEVSI